MLKLLIRLALLIDFCATLRTAAKLEYGAGIFCFKLAIRAEDEGYLNLAQFLKQQFAEEDSHARMLGGLVDGRTRLHRNCQAGVWSKGDYQALDGISQRYWAAKLFFWFRKPEELDWADTLAFMCVVESQVAKFYEVLGETRDNAVVALANKILQDETQHADYLKNCLSCFHSDPQGAIAYWQDRKVLAAIGGLIDLVIGHWHWSNK
ncbi:ferritin-like domain-containing protein [Nostoc sp.]|uniref:ferritin-like domain-containing protein n=1 Tax=Nostoc sp. TaxID=1180 RepID=UPI002FF7233E